MFPVPYRVGEGKETPLTMMTMRDVCPYCGEECEKVREGNDKLIVLMCRNCCKRVWPKRVATTKKGKRR
jgi:hypothetical protein